MTSQGTWIFSRITMKTSYLTVKLWLKKPMDCTLQAGALVIIVLVKWLLLALLYDVPKFILVPDGAVLWVGLIVVSMSLPLHGFSHWPVCIYLWWQSTIGTGCSGFPFSVFLPVHNTHSFIHSFMYLLGYVMLAVNSTVHWHTEHTQFGCQWSCCCPACYNVIPSHVVVISCNYWVCWLWPGGAAKCSLHCTCEDGCRL
jgi:hypothetical protein